MDSLIYATTYVMYNICMHNYPMACTPLQHMHNVHT